MSRASCACCGVEKWCWRICPPRWVELKNLEGESFGWAIAFTIDAGNPQYAGDLDEQVVVHRLATASGGLGSCADYLFQTHDSLHANGIRDIKLERLSGYRPCAVCMPQEYAIWKRRYVATRISPVSGEV